MIKAIIFDFDGTLSNRQLNAYDFFYNYFKNYFSDFDEIEYEAMLQDMLTYDCNGTIPVKYRIIPFVAKYGKYLPDNFSDTFIKDFYDNMYKSVVLKQETRQVLEKLKGKYKLAILSNGDSISQHNKINALDIVKYFDEVLVSGDIGIHKPDKEVFEYLADKLNVKCEECLMIGDVFSTDILGAYNANMLPVWISKDLERPSRNYHGYRINDLNELFVILEKEGC